MYPFPGPALSGHVLRENEHVTSLPREEVDVGGLRGEDNPHIVLGETSSAALARRSNRSPYIKPWGLSRRMGTY